MYEHLGRFIPIVRELNAAKVDYVIVGGVAANLLGHVRGTVDLDLIVAFAETNIEKLTTCLKKAGFMPRMAADPAGLADDATRASWQERNMVVYAFVSVGNPPMLVDVFIQHPIPYPEMRQAAEEYVVDGEIVRVCSVDHLIHLKTIAGRPQDLLDIKQLRHARGK